MSNTANGHTSGPWFVSGVRFRMNGSDWHAINRYDEAKKQDDNIACVGFDPRTGLGMADARLIAAAPDLLDACTVALGHLTGGMDGDWRDCDPVRLLLDAIDKAEGAPLTHEEPKRG